VSEVRFNFLHYNPDSEDTENQGLVKANNVLHEPEGYKPLHLASAGSFATTGGLAASAATVLALVAKPVGSQGDLFCAWLSGGSFPTLHVGLNGLTGVAATTGYPLSFTNTFISASLTPIAIFAFDVCESYGKIFWNVEARLGTASPSTTQALKYSAYMDF